MAGRNILDINDSDIGSFFSCGRIDLPPEKVSSYNVSKTGQEGGINGQEDLYSRTDHQ